ncbi:MAG TPA: hypothetical protein OQH54_02940 [Nitrosopumilus sp.]|nr:hypothetical protein [Thermoproteota archaeon]HJJ22655.1 hypothetical protein [Nitrosopumilus sp.]
MDEIQECECPPTSESYENEDGMIICVHVVAGFRQKTDFVICCNCKKD